jgi:uncharacterized membrane protein
MNWSDIGKEISKYAPLVGGALGGAAGAGIGTLISSVLGCDDDPKAISNALSDPANIEKIVSLQKSHEVELQKAMIAASVEHAKIDQADRQDARHIYKSSMMPPIITVILFVLFALMTYAMFVVPIPPSNKQAADMIFGAVITWCGITIHGYFGGDPRSTKKGNR